MSRSQQTVIAIAAAGCMAAAFTTTMTSPASAQSMAPAKAAAATSAETPAVVGEFCLDNNGWSNNDEFYRCTGTAQTSSWVGSSCAPGNSDAKSSFNVYDARNECVGALGHVRVWLHEYTDYTNGHGWAVCINPGVTGQEIDPADQHPENIQVTTNTETC